MKKAYVFPGQAAQFEGMGRDLYENHTIARDLFEAANDILGYRLSDIMFSGTAEDLRQTKVTQPSVFLHSVIKAAVADANFQPDAVAGHSLGEFSALVAAGSMDFESGLRLVHARATAMQAACEATPSTMAAILGLADDVVENICQEVTAAGNLVVAANYNTPGQLVISGTVEGVQIACELLKTAGAKRALPLAVGGAFHSPLMKSAEDALREMIEKTNIKSPICPIYQNVDAQAQTDSTAIKNNLIAQLTAPVRWTQIMRNMIADGVTQVYEVGGTGKVLRGMFSQIDKTLPTETL
ncbi:MAG: Malonyl CoA-acyl carrier protein transacylase [Bacteroidota bacterium]|jgi:[acyl-carrier-protein] S-malonyltransferase